MLVDGRPIADVDAPMAMLRCGPSNRTFTAAANSHIASDVSEADKANVGRCGFCWGRICALLRHVYHYVAAHFAKTVIEGRVWKKILTVHLPHSSVRSTPQTLLLYQRVRHACSKTLLATRKHSSAWGTPQ